MNYYMKEMLEKGECLDVRKIGKEIFSGADRESITEGRVFLLDKPLRCWHSVPHDRVRMCTAGVCPETHKKCRCSETPTKIDITKHQSTSRGELRWK